MGPGAQHGVSALDGVAVLAVGPAVTPDRDTELALTERVGRELARLGLHTHVGRMRADFAAVRAGRR